TAKEVTSLSGRGVGMDVVRRKIENIGGVVEIQSEESKGSTFKIKIPLTLAIIQALLVQVDKYIYSIPINSVIETLRIGPEDIEILENTEVIRVREEVLSLVQLNRLFKHKTTESNDEYFYVIVVGTSNKKVGLGVDNLVGEQDIVIKPLNNKYTNVQGIAGATILGDGQVSLVLDVSDIFALIASQKRHLLFVK
ncbi:MAG: chemotaxis protein CheW, partial [Spirochaetota bacterium]|nr:chemotaxis protein CheW [Spirochaetota bacterium]